MSEVSFIIPVLDYAKASPYNIKTLLHDLQDVEGEVIVVFNNEEMYADLKDHPRIDYYASLKKNVGVSRAWNIGLNISRTPYTFILNSDVSINPLAITKTLHYLKKLDKTVLVGPQGAFVNFEKLKDFYFFDKGSFNEPVEVDAVAGFFFAINNELWNSFGLSFDNQYTPCYFEEWDIGLQIKKVGLKAYVVPVDEYDHQWSGSIKTYKKISFYDEELTPKEILELNRLRFKKKWSNLISEKVSSELSLWKFFALRSVERLSIAGDFIRARGVLDLLCKDFIDDKEIFATLGLLSFYEKKLNLAKEFYEKSLAIDPFYEIAKINLDAINTELKNQI